MSTKDELEKYSRAVDEMAWYGRGSMIEIAKLAKKLNRNYTLDLAERKKLLLDSKKAVR